jgi:2-isopropylmalate synthase
MSPSPSDSSHNNRVRVFDTTLRDGEQAPGCSMSRDEKIRVAHHLARLGVDVIEAGFPAASHGEVESVSAIAHELSGEEHPIICGLARANERDIDTCARAIRPARKKRIHTFIATSPIHMEHKLRMTPTQVLEAVRRAVTHARSLCEDVEFSAEDASRSDPNFLCDVFATAVGCGATTINVPDTVGYATPPEYAALIARIVAEIGAPNVIISTHCHNDLGMAVANTLAGVKAGARQVECTINGIGERAGNASLEEVVMAIQTRQAFFGVSTGVRTQEIAATSHAVSQATGVYMPSNKAIVGANAFAHEAGIHQDGVLKHRETYEIMRAEHVGATAQLVLGKHSGKNAFQHHVRNVLKLEVDDTVVTNAFERFKVVADAKKVVTSEEIATLIEEVRSAMIMENTYA